MFSFIALFVISLNTFSGTIDSLKKVLNTASGDSLRVELLLKMGDHYENSQLDSSLFYYKKALDYTNLEKTPFLF